MKTFLVTLLLRLGEYEKLSVSLIAAEDSDSAELKALEDESHNTDAGFDESEDWWDDNFVYEIHSCKEVSVEDLPIIKKYMN